MTHKPLLIRELVNNAYDADATEVRVSMTDDEIRVEDNGLFERNKPAFHARFREHAARIIGRHGFDIAAMWKSAARGRIEFAYLLARPDEGAKRSAWAAFMVDNEWKEIKRATSAAHGGLVGAIEDRMLVPVDYSPAIPRAGAGRE